MASRRQRAAGVTAMGIVALAVGACAQIIGLEPFAGETGGGGGASASSGGPIGGSGGTSVTASGGGGTGGSGRTCPGSCAAKVDGWQGPIGLLRGTPEEVCPPGWDAEPFIYDDPPELSCGGCTCGAPHDACSATFAACDEMCGNVNTCLNHTVGVGSCVAHTVALRGSVNVASVTATGGRCDGSGTPVAPAVTWSTIALRCKPPAQADCGSDGVCLPEPKAAIEICVWQDGKADCPSVYPERRLYATDGHYTCPGSCACGAPQGVVCSPASSFEFFSDTGCTQPNTQVSPTGCTDVSSGKPDNTAAGVRILPNAAGSCDPVVPALFKADAQVTVCCR